MREATCPDKHPVTVSVQPSWLRGRKPLERLQKWNATLATLEAIAFGRETGVSVSIGKERGRLRTILDLSGRDRLRALRQLSPVSLARSLRSSLRRRKSPCIADASTLVPALLTFVDRPLRILLIGPSAQQLPSVRRRLQAHAPWHRYNAASIDQLSRLPHFDLALIAVPRIGPEDSLRLSVVSTKLKLFCGVTPELLVARTEPLRAAPSTTQADHRRKAA